MHVNLPLLEIGLRAASRINRHRCQQSSDVIQMESGSRAYAPSKRSGHGSGLRRTAGRHRRILRGVDELPRRGRSADRRALPGSYCSGYRQRATNSHRSTRYPGNVERREIQAHPRIERAVDRHGVVGCAGYGALKNEKHPSNERDMAPPTGFEPATDRVETGCAIRCATGASRTTTIYTAWVSLPKRICSTWAARTAADETSESVGRHHTKDKGDLGVAKAHADLVGKGFYVLFPAT